MSEPSETVTVSKKTVIWALVVVVVVAVLAALIGGWIGGAAAAGRAAPEPLTTASETPSPTPEPEPEETDDSVVDDELEDLIAEILPAGADVRAGRGAPAADHGATGDVYIDLTNSDVFVRRDSGWERVGNLRVDSAENLRGEQGVPGSPGDRGDRGDQGDAGQDGTQVVLGADAPDADATCDPDGSVYIDTSTSTYYSCLEGSWVLFGAE